MYHESAFFVQRVFCTTLQTLRIHRTSVGGVRRVSTTFDCSDRLAIFIYQFQSVSLSDVRAQRRVDINLRSLMRKCRRAGILENKQSVWRGVYRAIYLNDRD